MGAGLKATVNEWGNWRRRGHMYVRVAVLLQLDFTELCMPWPTLRDTEARFQQQHEADVVKWRHSVLEREAQHGDAPRSSAHGGPGSLVSLWGSALTPMTANVTLPTYVGRIHDRIDRTPNATSAKMMQ